MGRPPCCDKVGIKKGPWTPEEDIILVSYIQQHGPGNWRSVPTNTGLLRCSKSCRLRWTNYLRPGIKRGNFTPHEEGMIIHLQSLMGNKWAAIASYLPQRTDNDIKNYWNTHLKKKLKKFQSALEPHQMASSSFSDNHNQAVAAAASSVLNRFKTANTTTTTTTTTYASSTENISRLLEGWMRNSPKNQSKITQEGNLLMNNNLLTTATTTSSVHEGMNNNHQVIHKMEPQICSENLISHEEFESLLSFENMGSTHLAWEKLSSSDSNFHGGTHQSSIHPDISYNKQQPSFCLIEKWLLDEAATAAAAAAAGQNQDMIELSPIDADDEHDHEFPIFL